MATQTPWGPLKALIERFDEHNFGPDEIQRLVQSADVLIQIGKGTLTREVISPIIAQVVNPFAKEKRQAALGYPERWMLKHPEVQVGILRELYPGLDGSHVAAYTQGWELPVGCDGGFAVFPKLVSVAARFGITNPSVEMVGYGRLLEEVLCARLAKQRTFKNWRAGELKSHNIRLRESTQNAIQRLEEEQPEGDFLVVPVQTGKKWAGYSVRNARWEMEHGTTEFPLPAWVVGHMLLTHPERLGKFEDLCIDCPGDEYRFEPGEEFDDCLFFGFGGGRLGFGGGWVGGVRDGFGSASGFLR